MMKDDICRIIKGWLDNRGWRYDFDERRTLFRMGVVLDCKIAKVRLYVDVRDDFYIVYAILPINCSKCLNQMVLFLTMANFGLINGNFEVDIRDGEIRYKTYVNFHGMSYLSNLVVQDSIFCACQTVRKYADSIAKIIVDPEKSDVYDEIKNCEPQQGR